MEKSKLIKLIKGVFNKTIGIKLNSNEVLNNVSELTASGPEVLIKAGEYFYGLDVTENKSKAFSLYQKALKLGEIEAYRRIGDMYKYGSGVNRDKNKSFDFFKNGASKGDYNCFAEMAYLYEDKNIIKSAYECWNKYFEHPLNDIDLFGVNYLSENYCFDYIEFVYSHNLPLKNKQKLKIIEDLLIERAHFFIDELGEDFILKKENIIDYIYIQLN